jgi:uncharacterized protein
MNKIDQIKKRAEGFLKSAKGSHGWDHTLRVHNLCLHIGKKEKADLEILEIAAFLHDIGRPCEDEQKGEVCHAQKGAEMAGDLLAKLNFEKEKIDKVIHCIEAHRFRGTKIPQSLEAKILFDSDKLDSIGAVGIGRAFLFAGEVGARLHNKDVDIEKTKPYTVEDTAYREYMVKLRKIKDRMLTKEGKRIARERHEYMAGFFNRMNKETDGIL